MHNLLTTIYALKHQLPELFHHPSHLPTKETISEADDFSFSRNDDKWEAGEAEDILDRLKYWVFKLYTVVGDSLHHLHCLVDSFIMLGKEAQPDYLMSMPYRHCADSIVSLGQILSQTPKTNPHLQPQLE